MSKHVDLIIKYLCYHIQITTTVFKEKYINCPPNHCTETICSLKHLTLVSAWRQVKEKNNEYHVHMKFKSNRLEDKHSVIVLTTKRKLALIKKP
jgi:hypothetical protein